MPRIATFTLSILVLALGIASARAGVLITVDKSTQRLSVVVDGWHRYQWPVSTARWGYHTPNGTYRPQRLEAKWYSRKYDMSPMPHSIFFNGGYAIHGSYELSRIGRPASHGCIRLSPQHAAMLFALVKAHRHDTRIVVTGERPSRVEVAQQRTKRREIARARPIVPRDPGFDDIFEWRPPSHGFGRPPRGPFWQGRGFGD
jgi:hypothetical protein